MALSENIETVESQLKRPTYLHGYNERFPVIDVMRWDVKRQNKFHWISRTEPHLQIWRLTGPTTCAFFFHFPDAKYVSVSQAVKCYRSVGLGCICSWVATHINFRQILLPPLNFTFSGRHVNTCALFQLENVASCVDRTSRSGPGQGFPNANRSSEKESREAWLEITR